MINYKELYDELVSKLTPLQNTLSELSVEKELSEREYAVIYNKLDAQVRKRDILDQERKYLLYSKKSNLEFGVGMVVLFLNLLAFALFAITTFQAPTLLLLWLVTFLAFGVINIRSGKFVQKKLTKRLLDKIINSEEYQRMLSEIESLENNINLSRKEMDDKQLNLTRKTADYDSANKELLELNSLINYVESMLNSQAITLQEAKPYARRRIQEQNNDGNME